MINPVFTAYTLIDPRVKSAWRWFFFVKCVYMLVALFIYSNFSSLGDTDRYLNAGFQFGVDVFWNSTVMMDAVTGFSAGLLGSTLGNVPFIFLACFGLIYSASRAGFSTRNLIFLLIVLSFPSFGIWTSIASKEAVCVFWLGLLLGAIFDINYKRKVNLWLMALAFYLGLIFKPQYVLVVIILMLLVYFRNSNKVSVPKTLFIVILIAACALSGLYLFREELNLISFQIPLHFDPNARSTRSNDIWVEDYDIFFNAPYGMFIALQGPKVSEAFSNLAMLPFLLESWILFGLLGLGILSALLRCVIVNKRISIYLWSLFACALLGFAFAHYPFGVLNPGSAIRYRSGFMGFWIVLFYWLYLQSMVVVGRGTQRVVEASILIKNA